MAKQILETERAERKKKSSQKHGNCVVGRAIADLHWIDVRCEKENERLSFATLKMFVN